MEHIMVLQTLNFPTSTWEMSYKILKPPPVAAISQVLPQTSFDGLPYRIMEKLVRFIAKLVAYEALMQGKIHIMQFNSY